jgi:hypothetical protein
MKNILAENMLRFGVKNLSAKSKRKLAEQSTVPTTTVPTTVANITLLTNLLDESKKMVKSIDASTERKEATIVAFPAGSDGVAKPGDFAILNGEGLIKSLGGTYYLTIGNFRKLDDKMQAGGATAGIKLLAMEPAISTENSYGKPARTILEWATTVQLPFLFAAITKQLYTNDKTAFTKILKPSLVAIAKASKGYGIQVPIDIDKPEWDAANVDKYLI